MPQTSMQILEKYGLDRLSMDDLIVIRESINDIIDQDMAEYSQLELSDEFKAELERRDAEANAHPETCIPWEDVYAKIMKKYERQA